MCLLVAQLAIHCDSVHPQGSASEGRECWIPVSLHPAPHYVMLYYEPGGKCFAPLKASGFEQPSLSPEHPSLFITVQESRMEKSAQAVSAALPDGGYGLGME